MSRTTSVTSRSPLSVGAWALLLSVTAATLAAVVGIHSLGDAALDGGATSVSSVAQAAAADDAAAQPLPPSISFSAAVDETVAGLTGDGGALGCALLALLCVVTLAVALLRTRGAAARTLDPLASPARSVPPASSWRRRPALSLTALGISRI